MSFFVQIAEANCSNPRGTKISLEYIDSVDVFRDGDALFIRTKLCRFFELNKLGKNVGVTSSTHAAFIKLLNEQNRLVAVSNPNFHYEPLSNVTTLGFPVSMEKIIASKIDYLFTYEPFFRSTLSVTQVPIFEYLESHPLGRFEWVKIFGFCFDKEREADVIYQKVRDSYLKKVTKKNGINVLLANYQGGYFEFANPNGYLSRLYKDAGFNVIHFGDRISLAKMLSLDLKIDFWFIHDIFQSLDQLITYDRKIEMFINKFKPKIFGPVRRVSSNGANDFFEQGVVSPDKILEEIKTIRDHAQNLYFYKELSK